jgi:hypothetical protein
MAINELSTTATDEMLCLGEAGVEALEYDHDQIENGLIFQDPDDDDEESNSQLRGIVINLARRIAVLEAALAHKP